MDATQSTMHSAQRKRGVSSCIPCYTRKQKCDREYPCSRCTKRRRPELCAYYSSEQTQAPVQQTSRRRSQENENNSLSDTQNPDDDELCDPATSLFAPHHAPETISSSSLSEVFGYFELSQSNIAALVRKLGHDFDGRPSRDIPIPEKTLAEIQSTLETIPGRPILDFLVRIDQLLYSADFLSQYQKWWGLPRPFSIADVEFSILFLSICSYASHFLPSPAYTIDSIKGSLLSDIRISCERAIGILVPICAKLDPSGSLHRVQYMILTGLAALCQGKSMKFREALCSAISVSQRIGLHMDPSSLPGNLDEIEKEMRRRTLCNLYIWDSQLSERMDLASFMPDKYSPELIPRMHLRPINNGDVEAPDTPDPFAERVLIAKLAQFWRNQNTSRQSPYDGLEVHKRYDIFCKEFIPTIPPAFSLQPNKTWDESLPILPMQRQLFHIEIFQSVCYNFKPVLHMQQSQINELPDYKQVLLGCHKKVLAAASLCVLQGVGNFHTMMLGGSHTKFAGIVVPVFETAVVLLALCAENVPAIGTPSQQWDGPNHDILGVRKRTVTRAECMQAARDALTRLQTLADFSVMAETGANILASLLDQIHQSNQQQQSPDNGDIAMTVDKHLQSDWGLGMLPGITDSKGMLADFLVGGTFGEMPIDWEQMLQEFPGEPGVV